MSTWKSNRVMWDCNSPYKYRDDNLRALGFRTYRAYLASALWASIRGRVLERDGGKCQRCGKRRHHMQAHHRAYDPATLRGDRIDAISAVCGGCHTKAERGGSRSSHDRLAEASHMILKRPRKKAKRLAKVLERERRLVAEQSAAPRLVRPE